MRIYDGTFRDVLDYHVRASIKLRCEGELSIKNYQHLLVKLFQITASVCRICNHIDCNVSQNVFSSVFKITNFPETWDEENSDFIIIVVHNILDQISAEAWVVLHQQKEISLLKARTLAVLRSFDCCRSSTSIHERDFAKIVSTSEKFLRSFRFHFILVFLIFHILLHIKHATLDFENSSHDKVHLAILVYGFFIIKYLIILLYYQFTWRVIE